MTSRLFEYMIFGFIVGNTVVLAAQVCILILEIYTESWLKTAPLAHSIDSVSARLITRA